MKLTSFCIFKKRSQKRWMQTIYNHQTAQKTLHKIKTIIVLQAIIGLYFKNAKQLLLKLKVNLTLRFRHKDIIIKKHTANIKAIAIVN